MWCRKYILVAVAAAVGAAAALSAPAAEFSAWLWPTTNPALPAMGATNGTVRLVWRRHVMVSRVARTNGAAPAAIAGWSTNGYVYRSPWGGEPLAVSAGGPDVDYPGVMLDRFAVPSGAPSNAVCVTNIFRSHFAWNVPTNLLASFAPGPHQVTNGGQRWGEQGYVESVTDVWEDVVATTNLSLDTVSSWRIVETERALAKRLVATSYEYPLSALPLAFNSHYQTHLGEGAYAGGGLMWQDTAHGASSCVHRAKAFVREHLACGAWVDPVLPVSNNTLRLLTEQIALARINAPTNYLDATPASSVIAGGYPVGHVLTSTVTLIRYAGDAGAVVTNQVRLWNGETRQLVGAAGSNVTVVCTNAWIEPGRTHLDYGWRYIPQLITQSLARLADSYTVPDTATWRDLRLVASGHYSNHQASAAAWATAQADCEAAPTGGGDDASLREAWTAGAAGGDPLAYDASARRLRWRLALRYLTDAMPKRVTFYVCTTNLTTFNPASYSISYDGGENAYALGAMTLLCETNIGYSGSATSSWCGQTTFLFPEWCPAPSADTSTVRGYRLWFERSRAWVDYDFSEAIE